MKKQNRGVLIKTRARVGKKYKINKQGVSIRQLKEYKD